MVTWTQLVKGIRVTKRRALKAPLFKGAPHRTGIIYAIATMPPRKPNSAKRTIAKLRLNLVVNVFLLRFQGKGIISFRLIVLCFYVVMALKILLV
jgi:ribosomal protein S12